jgi:uncharacterized protein YbcC (UPF0753/DUF2309 family)
LTEEIINRAEKRLTIRTLARLASEVLAQYWPIRTFVHHNPLHELEYLHFSEALERAHNLLGARPHLSNETYRQRFQNGLIKAQTVETVLSEQTENVSVLINKSTISKLAVRRACLKDGIDLPSAPQFEILWQEDPQTKQLDELASHVRNLIWPEIALQRKEKQKSSSDVNEITLIRWVDRTLGTDWETTLNNELSRWCGAFLDEGEAGWPMPQRRHGFFLVWKSFSQLSSFDNGDSEWKSLIKSLPENPEDVIIEMLERLQIPEELVSDYFAAHLSSLPGWASFIKWRSAQQSYAWQQFPIDLVHYLAVRLVYETSMLRQLCKNYLGIEGNYNSIKSFMMQNPVAYKLLKQRVAGQLAEQQMRQVDRAIQSGKCFKQGNLLHPEHKFLAEFASQSEDKDIRDIAWRLRRLSTLLGIEITDITNSNAKDLLTLINWLDEFADKEQGMVWLKACEAEYQEGLFKELTRSAKERLARNGAEENRPQAQAVFCIDVRSEPFRRHLESVGKYETFGFAGFFNCFIRYKSLDSRCETNQFPVVMKARNMVREVPRPYHQAKLAHYQRGRQFLEAIREVFHDLKANLITPYVTVESLGWAYILPFVLRTLTPKAFFDANKLLLQTIQKPISTSLTVDKLPQSEAEQMVLDNQLAIIREAVIERFRLPKSKITRELIDGLRRLAMEEVAHNEVDTSILQLSEEKLKSFVEELRIQNQINPRAASAHKERLARTGFTLAEQLFTIETSLRMMGLSKNFARIVLICAHGSKSDNNPFESALDCGACGGNEGQANARVFAAMANRVDVRQELEKKGIVIPADTYFLAGQYSTSTDVVELFDLEDVPPTHRLDLMRLVGDLKEAGILTSQERCARLPDVGILDPNQASSEALRRSCDWSQVRPEWGLSGNAALIIGRREVTASINLKGRAFLNSYDYKIDPEGKLLENLMTAAQMVSEWINLEHYFSTVDNDVFGAGSKIYHNVTGHIGVMFGTLGDLRIGLPEQTVMKGESPYHEPLRLTAIIEAPRQRIDSLIARHELLQRFYHNEWVHLVAITPEDGTLYRYLSSGNWKPVTEPLASSNQESVGNIIKTGETRE